MIVDLFLSMPSQT